jgi:hypothetical protein
MMEDSERSAPQVITLGALLNEKYTPREFLLTPWLRQGEQGMLYAPPGLGKSMLALSMALAVAGGGGLIGWSAPSPSRVLLVDGEMPMDDIQARAQMLLPAVGGDHLAAGENLVVLGRHHQTGDADLPDLATDEGQASLLDIAHGQQAKLVILDNLSTLATIADENAASAFNDVVKFLARMKRDRLACILVHHSNKSMRGFRGSTKLATTFDAIQRLTATKLPREGNPAFALEWEKFRHERRAGAGEPMDVWLMKAKDGGGSQWGMEGTEDDKLDALVRLVKSEQYPSQVALASALGATPGAVSKWKAAAISMGKITKGDWKGCLGRAASAAPACGFPAGDDF